MSGSLSGPYRRNNSPDRLARRSGELIGTLNSRVTGQKLDKITLRSTVGSFLTPYAATQEYGAQGVNAIRPKKGKYLTIPAPANLTPAGLTRFPNPRSRSDIFFYLTKGKELPTLATLKGGKLQIMWFLKRSVEIKPRLGFRKTWLGKPMENTRAERLNDGVAAALRSVGLS